MEEKHLKRIAEELCKINKNFERMLVQMETSRKNLTAEPVVSLNIGSTGEIEPKHSDK